VGALMGVVYSGSSLIFEKLATMVHKLRGIYPAMNIDLLACIPVYLLSKGS
jgi:hypothetical protein